MSTAIDAARALAASEFDQKFDMEFTVDELHKVAARLHLQKANGTKPEIYEEYRVRLFWKKSTEARQTLSRSRGATDKVWPFLRNYRLLYWSFRRIYTRDVPVR